MDDILKLLGLIYRAKKMVLGEEILDNFKKVRLLFLASDISEKSRVRYEKKCSYYHVICIDTYDGEQLSNALGKNNVKAIGIIDDGFTASLLKKMK